MKALIWLGATMFYLGGCGGAMLRPETLLAGDEFGQASTLPGTELGDSYPGLGAGLLLHNELEPEVALCWIGVKTPGSDGGWTRVSKIDESHPMRAGDTAAIPMRPGTWLLGIVSCSREPVLKKRVTLCKGEVRPVMLGGREAGPPEGTACPVRASSPW